MNLQKVKSFLGWSQAIVTIIAAIYGTVWVIENKVQKIDNNASNIATLEHHDDLQTKDNLQQDLNLAAMNAKINDMNEYMHTILTINCPKKDKNGNN